MSSNNDSNVESDILLRFEELKEVPARDPIRAASGRVRFLSEATKYRQALSPMAQARQAWWIFPVRKQKFAMSALVTLVLAFVLFLGGGATIAAAQDALPTQALYQVKLWTEDTALALNGDPQEQANLLMDMAQTRVDEIAALSKMGITPPDQVSKRLEKHLSQALLLAANMDGPARDQVLLKLRERLQKQERILEQLQTQAGTETEASLSRTRQMLQSDLQLVDEGLANPQGFPTKIKNQVQPDQDKEVGPEPKGKGEPGGQPSGDPAGNGNGSPGNPNPDKPHNGNGGNGPGPDNSQGGNGSGQGKDKHDPGGGGHN